MNKYAKVFRSNNFLILNKDFLTLLNDLNTAVYLSYLIDKYVYLDRYFKMNCEYNTKFKRWVPISLARTNDKIISMSLLKNY